MRLNLDCKRPLRLTNKGCCFSNKEIKDILAKPNEEFGFYEYRTIFTISRCVGTYEELVYFLPLAFDHLRINPEDGLEYMSSLIHFVSFEEKQLEKDKLLEQVESELKKCFENWTKIFEVEHYDKEDCRKK